MITENDERVKTKSEYVKGLPAAVDVAFNYIMANIEFLKKMDWGINRIQVLEVMKTMDELLLKYDFELDARTRFHKQGIGNNNRWDILDKDLVKVGYFNCNSDMFGGVYIYVEVDGEKIRSEHLR